MPVEGIRAARNLDSTADTTSRWTGAVWQGFPLEGIRNGLVDGFVREWDFARIKPSSNVNAAEAFWDQGLRVFGSDGAPITVANGVALANGATVGSDGDNEGLGIRDQLVQVRLSRADKQFAFEACLATSTITDTKHGFVLGLWEDAASTATAPIAAAGTLTDLNFVGFHRLEGDGDKLDLVYKANGVTQVTQVADAITLVADTDVRLGMTFKPQPDFDQSKSFLFRWWLNGQPIASGYKQIPTTNGDDFPNDIALGWLFMLLNATASTPGTTTLRRLRYGQEF